MTAYADLDVSVIDELPPGARPSSRWRCRNKTQQGGRTRPCQMRRGPAGLLVCTLIDESEELRAQAAEETAARLAEALPDLRIGLVHGRMPPRAKDKAMQEFKSGRTQLLVATTVIEVGVDVPNASLDGDRKCRADGPCTVAPAAWPGGSWLAGIVLRAAVSEPRSQLARERMTMLCNSNDGFAIAQKDLELRGPGELLGTRQTGLAELKVADLIRDADLLPAVREVAGLLLRDNDELVAPLRLRWIGNAEEYGRVG